MNMQFSNYIKIESNKMNIFIKMYWIYYLLKITLASDKHKILICDFISS